MAMEDDGVVGKDENSVVVAKNRHRRWLQCRAMVEAAEWSDSDGRGCAVWIS